MATLAKGSALFFLIAFVICTVSGQYGYPQMGQAGAVGQPGQQGQQGQQGQPGQPRPLKVQVAETIPISVNHRARVAVPIMFDSNDYTGPYDPFDPRGIIAALHRQYKIDKLKRDALIKSYIPPGVGKFAKKEAIKLAVNEGRRFAVAHPKETAELVGIATKAKALYHTASHKLEQAENKENKYRH